MSDARLLTLHCAHLALLLSLAAWLGGGRTEANVPAALPLVASTHPAPLHDCNGNGIEDMVDIARGTSSDSDLDGVPDECQERRQASPQPLAAPASQGPRH
jgi:hypothetical protein